MMRGTDVLRLQTQLAKTQASTIGQPDGIFGQKTADAVRNFQKMTGATVDGIVGVETWGRLFGLPAGTGAAAPATGSSAAAAGAAPDSLDALTAKHRVFSDSITWSLTAEGLVVDDAIPSTTGGGTTLARKIITDFADPLAKWATHFDVPVELIVATIATESNGNPNALRKEPGFISDTKTPHRISPGLMQTLISTAAGALGRSVTRNDLLTASISIEAGTAYIKQQSKQTRFDPPVVACAYNAGSVKHQTGAENRWKMRQFPIGTAKHADRFVQHFNDLFSVLSGGSPFDKTVPSFHRWLN
jgi:hypothetical protein